MALAAAVEEKQPEVSDQDAAENYDHGYYGYTGYYNPYGYNAGYGYRNHYRGNYYGTGHGWRHRRSTEEEAGKELEVQESNTYPSSWGYYNRGYYGGYPYRHSYYYNPYPSYSYSYRHYWCTA